MKNNVVYILVQNYAVRRLWQMKLLWTLAMIWRRKMMHCEMRKLLQICCLTPPPRQTFYNSPTNVLQKHVWEAQVCLVMTSLDEPAAVMVNMCC